MEFGTFAKALPVLPTSNILGKNTHLSLPSMTPVQFSLLGVLEANPLFTVFTKASRHVAPSIDSLPLALLKMYTKALPLSLDRP